MGWYDWFSLVYDPLISPIYRGPRAECVAALGVQPGHIVLDLACGTGENMPFLIAALGDEGYAVGVDFSQGMLNRAERRFGHNARVRLICKDARELHIDDIVAATAADRVDRIICVLGLSVIPEWETVFSATWELLAPGGQYGILDVHAESWVPQTSVVQFIAGADVGRKVWEPLQAVADPFELTRLGGSPHIHGGHLYLATGTKPTPSSE